MKVRFYCDIWPGGMPTGGMFATTQPNRKIGSAKRFAFDVVIPDNLLHDVDASAPEPVVVTLIPEEPSNAE